MMLAEWRPFPPQGEAQWLIGITIAALVAGAVLVVGGLTGIDRSYVLMIFLFVLIPWVVGTIARLLRPRLDLPSGIVPLSLMFGVMYGCVGYVLFGGFVRNLLLAAIMSGVARSVARRELLRDSRKG